MGALAVVALVVAVAVGALAVVSLVVAVAAVELVVAIAVVVLVVAVADVMLAVALVVEDPVVEVTLGCNELVTDPKGTLWSGECIKVTHTIIEERQTANVMANNGLA